MPTEPEPVTLSQVVHRAVQVVDPDGGEGLDDLLVHFEDADEPLSSAGADSAAQRIAEGIGALDPQEEDGAVQMAGAAATHLAYRRAAGGEEPGALLELAARAEFNGGRPRSCGSGWRTPGSSCRGSPHPLSRAVRTMAAAARATTA